MTYAERLTERIDITNSNLCVGLDPRPVEHGNSPDGVRDFLRPVVEECAEFAACFKPNNAYFESMGGAGFDLLAEVAEWCRDASVPVILDCKRGDIGTTQEQYAVMAYEHIGADAVTLSPYMGRDSIEPFLRDSEKGAYLLGVTSNPGSADLQMQESGTGNVFDHVCTMAADTPGAGLVVGLTNAAPDILTRIPDVPLLMPGLGAQGGDLSNLSAGQTRSAPLVINVSRGILYSGDDRLFGDLARDYRDQIATALSA